jgi:hypothetical protein
MISAGGEAMSLNHIATAIFAAALLAGTACSALAQSDSKADVRDGSGNSAWTKPDVQSEPPTPNGGMSSGAHSGNESPTKSGNSAKRKSEPTAAQDDKDSATTGQK